MIICSVIIELIAIDPQVSYEYIACQQQKQGVLVLSEFAGAAQSLNGSIVVNPWDSQQVADAIYEAVTMPAEARAVNHEKLFKVSTEPDCICTDPAGSLHSCGLIGFLRRDDLPRTRGEAVLYPLRCARRARTTSSMPLVDCGFTCEDGLELTHEALLCSPWSPIGNLYFLRTPC